MILRTETQYPNRRTYVLKLCSDATPRALAGRLENLVSGKQREFTSASELLSLIADDIAGAERPRNANRTSTLP
jgi:hypothetical protein